MSQKFCIICCYSSQEQNRSVSNEAREHFDKFCTDLGFSFPTRVDEQLEKWCLKLPFGDSVTVCSNCLSEIVQYAQKRSMQLEQQDKLEELQKAVVKALKDLTVVVKDVETHINKLHTIMRNGDETCLDNFVKNASPKSTRKAEVRSFREKIFLISNEGSRPQHTFGLHHDMILPVVSSRRKDKLKLKVCKEEPTDPIDATCKYEEDIEEPYAEAVDEVSMELADDDFKGTMASGNVTSSRSRHGRGSLISKRNRKSRVSKKATKKRKQFSNMDTDNNAADAYIHCEFGDRDIDTEHDSAPQLALRRTKRQIRSTLIKQEADELELESDDGGGMEDAYSEDDGSNFSDVDADFRMLKGKQNFRSDSGSESDSSNDSAPVIDTETESIVCDVDVYETKPKRSKKKKKHKSSKPRVSLKGMSEFKTRVVNRVLRKLRRNSEGGHSTKDDYDGNGNNDNKKDTTDDVSDKIGVQSLNDPRMKYPLKFNAETRKLTVNDIEIVIDDNEMSLRCSLCDFEISEAEIRNKVRVKNVETVAHDHIIGSHIGSYKCGVCEKVYLTREQFTWHKRTHREKRNNCDICGRPFNTYYDMKRHKWHHMSKEEQEEAVKNGMPNFSKPYTELRKKSRSFQCEVCGKAFRTITEIRIHKQTHADNRERVMCNNCGKQYLPGPSMMYHELNCLKLDMKEVHECYICLKRCKNKITLGRHIKLHSAGPEILFTCSVCGKVIKTKTGLQRHVETVHSDVRPFVCEGCGSAFKLKKHLDRHQKVSCKFSSKSAAIKDDESN